MAKEKKAAALSHPVEPSKWARIRDAERVTYGAAEPIRTNWKSGDTYTCPELSHRSAASQPPSLVMGRGVSR